MRNEKGIWCGLGLFTFLVFSLSAHASELRYTVGMTLSDRDRSDPRRIPPPRTMEPNPNQIYRTEIPDLRRQLVGPRAG